MNTVNYYEEVEKYEVVSHKGYLFKETATFFKVDDAVEYAQKKENEGYLVKIIKISCIIWQ